MLLAAYELREARGRLEEGLRQSVLPEGQRWGMQAGMQAGTSQWALELKTDALSTSCFSLKTCVLSLFSFLTPFLGKRRKLNNAEKIYSRI